MRCLLKPPASGFGTRSGVHCPLTQLVLVSAPGQGSTTRCSTSARYAAIRQVRMHSVVLRHRSPLDALSERRVALVQMHESRITAVGASNAQVLLSGSFNPLHEGHKACLPAPPAAALLARVLFPRLALRFAVPALSLLPLVPAALASALLLDTAALRARRHTALSPARGCCPSACLRRLARRWVACGGLSSCR